MKFYLHKNVNVPPEEKQQLLSSVASLHTKGADHLLLQGFLVLN